MKLLYEIHDMEDKGMCETVERFFAEINKDKFEQMSAQLIEKDAQISKKDAQIEKLKKQIAKLQSQIAMM